MKQSNNRIAANAATKMKTNLILFAPIFLFVCVVITPGQNETTVKSEKARGVFIEIGNVKTYYLEWGRKEDKVILLLHGLYDDSATWIRLGPMLARGYRVIAPDRRGAGRSGKPTAGYDFDTLAGDVISLIEKLQLGKVDLIGHSAGGGVALTIAARRPEMVRSLVLIDGGFWPKQKESKEASKDPSCRASRKECDRIAAITRGSMDFDPEPLYAKVSSPTLLLLAIPPDSQAGAFAKQLGEARTAFNEIASKKFRYGFGSEILNSGHWVQNDQPAELAAKISAFLKDGSPKP